MIKTCYSGKFKKVNFKMRYNYAGKEDKDNMNFKAIDKLTIKKH